MTPVREIEDSPQDPEPEGSSVPAVPEPPVGRLRGHHPGIDAAVTALDANDMLPPYLRPAERDRRIQEWLAANGSGNDLPSRWAIRRYLNKRGR